VARSRGSASAHDYAGFYDTEIKKRHDLGYPPFRRLVRLLFRDENEAKARQMATQAATLLHNRLKEHEMTGTEIIGPAPCFFTRINRSYRWQVLLRGADPTAVLRDFTFPSGWLVDVDPVDIL